MITPFLPDITDTEWTVIKYTVVLSTLAQLGWFAWWHRSNELKTERQRAYVLSLLSSMVMTLGSLPYVYQVTYHQRGNLDLLLTSTSTSAFRASPILTLMPVALTTFFMSFLILDLIVGLVWYKSKIEVLTGYAHHLVYFCLLAWVLNRHYGGIFMGMCVLEIPTLLLSAGSVHGPWRRDYLFALTFLATRIVFHGYIVFCAYSLYGLAPITRALAAFLPVHLYWFFGFIQQQKRLYRLGQEKKEIQTTITNSKDKKGTETTIVTPTAVVTMRNDKKSTTITHHHTVPSSGKLRGFWDRAYQRLRQEQREQEQRQQLHTLPSVSAH